MDLKNVVEAFALNVSAQTDAIMQGDRKGGSKYARRYVAAFNKLQEHGDAGLDALASLLTHPRMDVRVNAAIYLLKKRPLQAKPVLEEAAKGKGLIPFVASRTLKYWEEGTWNLDD